METIKTYADREQSSKLAEILPPESVAPYTDGNEFASGEVKKASTEWVDLGLPSGTLWADRNVGANAPEEYGNYYDFGAVQNIGLNPPYQGAN